jgi:hypothetical protein
MKRIPPSVRMKEELQQLLCGQAGEEAAAETPMRGFVRSLARYMTDFILGTHPISTKVPT